MIKDPIHDYKYRCEDKSIILQPFKKWIVSPLMIFVPISLPANIVTFLSNSMLYFCLYLTLVYQDNIRFNFLIVPFLILLYVIGDHLDGMQAKRTGTDSPLGEFLDHYLDIFNNGILLVIILTMFQVNNNYIITLLFFSSYLAHAALMYEKLKTGQLNFNKIGSLELIVLLMTVILFGYSRQLHHILVLFKWKGLSILELILIACSLIGIFTFLKAYKRIEGISVKFFLYILFSLVIGIYFIYHEALIFKFTVITLYNGYYIGCIMHGYLVDGKERCPDFIVPSFITILFITKMQGIESGNYKNLILFYQFSIIVFTTFRTGIALRSFWVWKNPS